MNSTNPKFILESPAFYTFTRHYKDRITAIYEMDYCFFDTKDFQLLQNGYTARIRAIQSKNFKSHFEFKLNTNVLRSNSSKPINTVSAFLQPNDVQRVLSHQISLLLPTILPSSIINTIKEKTHGSPLETVAIYKINRTFLTFEDVLIRCDKCTYDNSSYFEISYQANNSTEALEKVKGLLNSFNISFSFSTLSKLSRIDVFVPHLNMLPK